MNKVSKIAGITKQMLLMRKAMDNLQKEAQTLINMVEMYERNGIVLSVPETPEMYMNLSIETPEKNAYKGE